MTTAERIQQRRQELDLTQEQVANKMGLKDRSSITKLEKSGNYISFKKLEQVADVLDCSVAYLLGMVSDPHEEHPDIVPLGSGRNIQSRTATISLPPYDPNGKSSNSTRNVVIETVGSPRRPDLPSSITGVEVIQRNKRKMSDREELIKTLYDLDDNQIKEVKSFVKYLKSKSE